MGQAIKSICELINNAIHSWSATARFVTVLLALALVLWIATAFAPWPSS
jgi:Tfp pilus assembly protein PilO